MSRTLGTVARGVRTPIFREGDNVVEGVVSSVLTALKENGIQPGQRGYARSRFLAKDRQLFNAAVRPFIKRHVPLIQKKRH